MLIQNSRMAMWHRLASHSNFLPSMQLSRQMCAGSTEKGWRLSASVVMLAPYKSVPDSELSDLVTRDSHFNYRVCFVKRAAKSSFMPDAMVFPGGAVDVADAATVHELFDSEDLDVTVRCAAVREVFEESGVGIFHPPLKADGADHAAWRRRLRSDAGELRMLCSSFGITPALASLHPWCSFITPDIEHQRLKKGGFDTRFFVWCATEADLVNRANADLEETVDLVWLTPSEALTAVAAGSIAMAPPQWYIMKELHDFCADLTSVPLHAASPKRTLQREYPIKPYPVAVPEEDTQIMLQRHGVTDPKDERVFALAYPGDESHPVFPGPTGARHRMVMLGKKLGGRMRFDLQLDASPQLPLKEATENWYKLAKL